jgi:predicted MFS family arabinose efflux permease
MSRKEGNLVRHVLLLAVGTFALGVNAYMMAGLLPGISLSLHTSLAASGQLVTVFALSYALAGPIIVTLLGGFTGKAVLASALVIFVAANCLSAIAGSLPSLLLARVIAGVGAGVYSPIATAVAVTLMPTERRGQALAVVLGGLSAGTVFGVPVGLFLAHHVGWRAAMWMICALGVISLAGILLGLPARPLETQPSLRERASALADPRISAVVSVSFIAALAGLGLYTYLAPVLDSAGGVHNPIVYLWAWGIGAVIGSFGVGAVIDHVGRATVIVSVILAVTALTFVAIPLLATHHVLVLLPLVIWGILGFATPVPQQHRLIAIRPNHAPVTVALNASAIYLGSAAGAALGGLVLALRAPAQNLAYLAAVVTVLALLLHLVTGRSAVDRNRSASFDLS